MRDHPTTLAAARAHRYNCWAGHPKGTPYTEGDCAFTVCTGGRAPSFVQCTRKNGHGPAGLYCSQHAAEVEGTSHLRGAKLVYWFGAQSSSWTKDATPRLWAFHVRKHGANEVRVTTPGHYRVLGLDSTTCRATKFADTPEAALAAYTERCRARHANALSELAAAAKAIEDCPTDPGEPGEIKD